MIRLALALCFWAGAGWAQSETAAAAQAAAARLAAASVLLDQAGGSDDQIAALTETVRAYEDGLGAMRDGLRRVAIRQTAIRAELEARSAEVAQLLGVHRSLVFTVENTSITAVRVGAHGLTLVTVNDCHHLYDPVLT